MKIVIDILEEDYEYIKDLEFYYSGRRSCKTIELHVINAIKYGKPVLDITDEQSEDFKPCNNMVNSDNIIFKSTEHQKIYSDMKLIKDTINDPNKNGFDICRLIKSITDEYDFKEEEK